jgi:hypothetical protein
MALFLVGYELHELQEYTEFYDALESYPHCWALEGCCLVATNKNAYIVYLELAPLVGSGDSLFVCSLGGQWFGAGYQCIDVLKEKGQ